MLCDCFKNKKVNTNKLIQYGFIKQSEGFIYKTDIADGHFTMLVVVYADGNVRETVVDKLSGEEYILYRIKDAVGSFVGMVRADIEAVFADIADKCFDTNIFKSVQTKQLIQYVRDRYGDELEFLWEKHSDNAIWRRKDNEKWYAAVLTVSARKLGIRSDEIKEVIDLRILPEDMAQTVDNHRYFLGYHMNKKHWYTICLDDSVPTEEICRRLDESYCLAGLKGKMKRAAQK